MANENVLHGQVYKDGFGDGYFLIVKADIGNGLCSIIMADDEELTRSPRYEKRRVMDTDKLLKKLSEDDVTIVMKSARNR